MSFTGYTEESLPFLGVLPTRDRDWFKANKKAYEAAIVGPTRELVAALGERLREHAPDIEAQPKTNGSIAPINNDLRFSPDKRPYKDHVLLRFWEGAPKKTAPTLRVRISAEGIGFASGIMPADLNVWRAAVASDAGAILADAVAGMRKALNADVAGEELKRVPAPYAADHPRADLLRHKMLQVRWLVPTPENIAKPGFADWCADRLEAAVPVHRWLVDEL
jgi:uncharacterized protein (TIGR02453 family)